MAPQEGEPRYWTVPRVCVCAVVFAVGLASAFAVYQRQQSSRTEALSNPCGAAPWELPIETPELLDEGADGDCGESKDWEVLDTSQATLGSLADPISRSNGA
jgi:hypothetical protein